MTEAFVQTYSGEPFYPTHPQLASINIGDIAHSLAMQCRYGGHVRSFYSVAEHCVILSHAVDPVNAKWALLHDATEAYVGDVVWPLKEKLPAFKAIEDNLMAHICTRFNLDPVQPEQVKEYDRRIVIDERDQLMVPTRIPWPALEGYEPLGVVVNGWSPTEAKAEYIARFRQLFNVN